MIMSASTAGLPAQLTLGELKAEAQARADRNGYPLIGISTEDAREALGSLTSLDRDDWALVWSKIGDRYFEQAETLVSADRTQADAAYLQAWRLYSFARWPVPNSPGKQRAYQKALAAFHKHGELQQPPLEVLRIPFEDTWIVGYRQLPAAPEPVPLVVAISGADSRKEDIAARFAALVPRGVGYVALESPGTGETPLKISATADRMFSAALDFIFRIPQVDPGRVLLYGGSFGGYWAAKLAVTEQERLRAVVVQSPPVHTVFQEEFLRTQTLANREYLFDLGPALMFMCENARTMDDLVACFGEMSLVRQGIIGQPTARMLVIHGVRDTQVPMSDIELLLRSGDVPKEAWINPRGGHMGREPKGWTDPVIFREVTMPWLLHAAAQCHK
jgi:dipeptidyl aminopeptidase/acylaminoacyl peptidase